MDMRSLVQPHSGVVISAKGKGCFIVRLHPEALAVTVTHIQVVSIRAVAALLGTHITVLQRRHRRLITTQRSPGLSIPIAGVRPSAVPIYILVAARQGHLEAEAQHILLGHGTVVHIQPPIGIYFICDQVLSQAWRGHGNVHLHRIVCPAPRYAARGCSAGHGASRTEGGT